MAEQDGRASVEDYRITPEAQEFAGNFKRIKQIGEVLQSGLFERMQQATTMRDLLREFMGIFSGFLDQAPEELTEEVPGQDEMEEEMRQGGRQEQLIDAYNRMPTPRGRRRMYEEFERGGF